METAGKCPRAPCLPCSFSKELLCLGAFWACFDAIVGSSWACFGPYLTILRASIAFLRLPWPLWRMRFENCAIRGRNLRTCTENIGSQRACYTRRGRKGVARCGRRRGWAALGRRLGGSGWVVLGGGPCPPVVRLFLCCLLFLCVFWPALPL